MNNNGYLNYNGNNVNNSNNAVRPDLQDMPETKFTGALSAHHAKEFCSLPAKPEKYMPAEIGDGHQPFAGLEKHGSFPPALGKKNK